MGLFFRHVPSFHAWTICIETDVMKKMDVSKDYMSQFACSLLHHLWLARCKQACLRQVIVCPMGITTRKRSVVLGSS